jgi:hypothetical protein
MEIQVAQEQIAEKLQYDQAWPMILDSDCDPGIYGVEDWDVGIDPNNIFVNFQKMEFTFKDVEFDFEVRIGASREDDSFDERHHKIASGNGKFKYANKKISEIYDIMINCNLDIHSGGKVTRR